MSSCWCPILSAVHLCSSGLPASPLQSSLSFTTTVRTIRTFAVLHSCTALSSDTANSGIQTSTTQFLVFFVAPSLSPWFSSALVPGFAVPGFRCSRFSLLPVFAVPGFRCSVLPAPSPDLLRPSRSTIHSAAACGRAQQNKQNGTASVKRWRPLFSGHIIQL